MQKDFLEVIIPLTKKCYDELNQKQYQYNVIRDYTVQIA